MDLPKFESWNSSHRIMSNAWNPASCFSMVSDRFQRSIIQKFCWCNDWLSSYQLLHLTAEQTTCMIVIILWPISIFTQQDYYDWWQCSTLCTICTALVPMQKLQCYSFEVAPQSRYEVLLGNIGISLQSSTVLPCRYQCSNCSKVVIQGLRASSC